VSKVNPVCQQVFERPVVSAAVFTVWSRAVGEFSKKLYIRPERRPALRTPIPNHEFGNELTELGIVSVISL
jgi:hypothetical protein